MAVDRFLPGFLTQAAASPASVWWRGCCSLLVPVSYRVTGLFGWLLRPIVSTWRRRRASG